MNNLVFSPTLPWPLLIAAVVAIVAIIGWSLAASLRSKGRMAALAALRLAALAAVVFIMLQPQQQRSDVTILRPQIAVLIDSSLSMTDPVDAQQPRRAERVQDWLRSPAVTQARRDFDLRLFTLDQTELSADKPQLAFTANNSNIVAALGQVQEHLRGQPLAAILVLSDGLDTSGVKAVNTAFAVPVDTFELEKPFTPKPRPQRLSIAGVDFPPRVTVGWHSDIQVSLAGSRMTGETVPVELWRDGAKVGGATTAFSEDEQTRQVTFQVTHGKAGVEQYEVRVMSQAADPEAKAYPFSISVLEPGKRVLYVQSQLGFDFKFLRQAIVSNRNLQLSAFVRWGDGRLVSLGDRGGQTTLDFSPKALLNNAVVILGDLPPDALPADSWRNLKEFVDHGGGLVILGGPRSLAAREFAQTPVGGILPVALPAPYREGNFAVQITAAGLHHPVFGPVFAEVKDFPPLLACNVSDGLAPNAESLMEVVVDGKPHPLVAAMRFGQGRVVTLLTDTVWRWRLAAKAWRADRSPYELFWTQLMDWLIPKEQSEQGIDSLALFTDRTSYVLGEKPEVRAILRTQGGKHVATLPLQIKTPDGKTFDYTMHPSVIQGSDGKSVPGFAATVEPNVAGVFRASSEVNPGGGKIKGDLRFVVGQPVTELTGKPIDRALLQAVAQAGHGKFYPLGNWDDWRKDIHVQEQHFSRLELADLWNRPLVLAVAMAALAADWILRKLWNLP